MWRVLVILLAIEQNGLAIPPLPIEHPWTDAVTAAKAELAACTRDAEAKHLVGDVIVALEPARKVWTATASKSLGALGGKIATCARDAIKKHYVVHVPRYVDWSEARHASEVISVGVTTGVLPPAATFVPAWRAAIAAGATKADAAAFAKLVPLDYKLDHGCLVGERPYVTNVEASWVEHAGTVVPPLWQGVISKLAPNQPWMAVWDGRELVTTGRGLCLYTFDAAGEATVRDEFDRTGTCWVGSFADILVHPRVAFPRDRTYTQVSVRAGRACAVTTTGAVTCCGATSPALATAPAITAVQQVAIGADFTCGLDAKGAATCTGSVTTAPTGPFRKLNASHEHVCGLRRAGTIECWGAAGWKAQVPPGTWVDLAGDEPTCGVHPDGTLACWGRDAKVMQLPGTYRAVAGAGCALHRDGRVGCFEAFDREHASTVTTVTPDVWSDLAVSYLGVCGRRGDHTIGCADAHPSTKPNRDRLVPPPGPFVQLAGESTQFCGVTAAGQVACWGRVWPGEDVPVHASATAHGTIVDERGAPLAGAEVMVCDELGPCSWIAHEARTKSGTLATLAANALKDPKVFRIVTTGADGTWSIPTAASRVSATITAPGREVHTYDVNSKEELEPAIVLRPAATIDLAAWCDGHACTSPTIGEQHAIWDGTHLEHVAPGTYRLVVWSDRGSKYERVGSVELEMPFAAVALTSRVVLHATGTGHTIRGTVDEP
ncbi:MAG: hypothetical protein ABI678_27050, partial [Kofleriaceae bacterium]